MKQFTNFLLLSFLISFLFISSCKEEPCLIEHSYAWYNTSQERYKSLSSINIKFGEPFVIDTDDDRLSIHVGTGDPTDMNTIGPYWRQLISDHNKSWASGPHYNPVRVIIEKSDPGNLDYLTEDDIFLIFYHVTNVQASAGFCIRPENANNEKTVIIKVGQ